jgi:hypothetical protein
MDLGGYTFGLDLNDRQSTSRRIGSIWTNEISVDADDRVPQYLAANFYLDGPTQEAGSLYGSVIGRSDLSNGKQWGELTWGDPLEISWSDFSADPAYPPDWGALTIALSGGRFNVGDFGLCPGRDCGLDIFATFTYDAPLAPVPQPPAILLFVSALGAVAVYARRARPASVRQPSSAGLSRGA